MIFTSKPRPNDCNISTQHVPTLLAQHLKASAKRSQHLSATHPNIVGPNMLRAFGHLVATCYDMLGTENRTSVHARAQHCWTDPAKRLQHYATSTNVAWKIWPFSNSSQQHPTCRNTSQQGSQTGATCCSQQCCDMLRWNFAIVWPGLDMYNKVVFYLIVTRFVPESSFDGIEYTYAWFLQDNLNWACTTVACYFVLASCFWICLVYTLRKVSCSLGSLWTSWTLSALWAVKPLGAHDALGSLCSIQSWRSSGTYRSLRAVEAGKPDWSDWALELSHVVYLRERWLQHVMGL